MSISSKIKTIFRGDIPFYDLPRELLRRKRATDRHKIERRELDEINNSPARLTAQYGSLTAAELLTHFRDRSTSFFRISGCDNRDQIAKLQSELFPDETAHLIASADRIVRDSSWELAGFGALQFNAENVWRRDPISGKDWGTDYHADVVVHQNDGSDIRVLWELNRFGHAITLARAFAATNDEAYAETFFSHIESWMRQNPMGRGANWNCAMEVALRVINLIAAFDIFRRAEACTEERLSQILRLFDQHGRFILDNNEFSYVATSNHYLSDVVGLFWIGTLLPELRDAAQWKEFRLREILHEMDKQILPDGADFEASTGYHKFVTEMLLFSFLLAERNSIEIPERYWGKLRGMLEYIRGIIRPDGCVPLIGDADGSQIVPVIKRDADDQAYLLALGAVVFDEPKFKASATLTPEVLWILGEKGTDAFRALAVMAEPPRITSFPDAGSYLMRDGDLYLHFNANDCGVNGRGSHGHNDALSIEVSAFGRPFIVDPGSYAYNLDREARQLFRSTAYHSTLEIDGLEQNSTNASTPFVIGNEAKPRVLDWETNDKLDLVVAEHYGYRRLNAPVTHRRTVEFLKGDEYWTIEDNLLGKGTHDFRFHFHFAEGLDVGIHEPSVVAACDKISNVRLLIFALDCDEEPVFKPNFVSRNYGSKMASQSACWTVRSTVPCRFRWLIMPIPPADRNVV